MWQGVNLRHISARLLLSLRIDVTKTGEGVLSIDVHCAGPTDAFTTGSTECECRVLLGFDLDERVEDHWAAVVQIHGVSGEVLNTRE